jgi:hypothetical protein
MKQRRKCMNEFEKFVERMIQTNREGQDEQRP